MKDPWNAVVVDDHQAIRSTARRLLQAAGHPVLGDAANGADGIAMVLDLDPDVVLLDVVLPDMTGVEVARRLREAKARAAIILISSHELEDLGDPVAESGAHAFISKSDLTVEAVEALGPFSAN